MDPERSKRSRVRSKSSSPERSREGYNKGAMKRKVAIDAIDKNDGSAIGSMVINADEVTMTINFNF